MNPKVVFLPLNYGSVVQDGVYDAFREAGCQLEVFDYFTIYLNNKSHRRVRDRLIEVCKKFQPDLVHCQIQHTNIIDAKTLQEVKSKCPKAIITNWTGDVRNYVPPTFRRIASVADYNLISSTGQMDFFKRGLSRPVKYWQIGFNPKLYNPAAQPPNRFDYDCCFTGHHNTKEKYPGAPTRVEMCQKMRNTFGNRFLLHGDNWPRHLRSKGSLNQRELMRVYQRSTAILSVSHYNDIAHYFSDRLLMCLASGRPTVALRFPKWESYFTDGCDLMIANDLDDMVQKVKYLKANPEHANFIGQQGAAKVMAEHTYLSRVNELLDMVGLR